MPKPFMDELLQKVPSKYTLVMAIAKRAKQLSDRRERFLRDGDANPVYKAMQEIADGKVVVRLHGEEEEEEET